jgi:hypothetical protein
MEKVTQRTAWAFADTYPALFAQTFLDESLACSHQLKIQTVAAGPSIRFGPAYGSDVESQIAIQIT